jgi:hypothetical protein
MKFRAANLFLLLFLALISLMISGCATEDPDNASVRPWNSPADWQQNGALGGMDTQHR